MDKPVDIKWKSFFSVVFASLFGLTLSVSLIAFNIENQLFNPDVYKKAILEQNVCDRLPLIISRQILSNSQTNENGNILGLVLNAIDPKNLENFLKLVFPCDAIENLGLFRDRPTFRLCKWENISGGILVSHLQTSQQRK